MHDGTERFADRFAAAARRSRHVKPHKTLTEESEPSDEIEVVYGSRLRDLPASDRPRERLRDLGPDVLSSAELVAVLLGSGTMKSDIKTLSENLISKYEGLTMLSRASWGELTKIHGIAEAKAAQLVAAFELGRRARVNEAEPSIGADLNGPSPMAEMMTPLLRDKTQEELWIILLDVRNRYRGKLRLYVGSCDEMTTKNGEILGRVLERNCPRFAVVHNHPSGKGDPSPADVAFTQRLMKAADSLDVMLVDHLIVGSDEWMSLRTSNLIDFGE